MLQPPLVPPPHYTWGVPVPFIWALARGLMGHFNGHIDIILVITHWTVKWMLICRMVKWVILGNTIKVLIISQMVKWVVICQTVEMLVFRFGRMVKGASISPDG